MNQVAPPARSSAQREREPAAGRRDLWCVLLLVALVALFFWRVVLAGQVLLPLDNLAVTEPWWSELEGRLAGRLAEPSGPDRVEISSYEPEAVTVRTSSDAAGLMVLADAMYPGWEGLADGKAQPVYYTNILLRGVLVPAGEHTVELRFRPASVRLGAAISAVTLVLVGTLLLATRRRRALRAG